MEGPLRRRASASIQIALSFAIGGPLPRPSKRALALPFKSLCLRMAVGPLPLPWKCFCHRKPCAIEGPLLSKSDKVPMPLPSKGFESALVFSTYASKAFKLLRIIALTAAVLLPRLSGKATSSDPPVPRLE